MTFVFLSCGLLGMMAQGTFERVGRTYGDVDIYFWLDSVGPPSTRSVAMRVYGQLPHRQATFTIDTGASINVLSPRMAQELGIQPDTADSSVSYLTHLEAILGRPLLEALGTTTFDFESRHITAPEHPKKRQKRTRRSNLSIDDNCLTLTLTHKVDKHVTDTLRLLTDFGATHTTLGPDYFFRHPTQFQTVRPDTVYFGGIGGLTKVLEYRLTDFPLWMSKRKSVLVPSLTVSASPTYEPRLGLDFFSHLRSVTIDLRRWRLILEPYK